MLVPCVWVPPHCKLAVEMRRGEAPNDLVDHILVVCGDVCRARFGYKVWALLTHANYDVATTFIRNRNRRLCEVGFVLPFKSSHVLYSTSRASAGAVSKGSSSSIFATVVVLAIAGVYVAGAGWVRVEVRLLSFIEACSSNLGL
jgi:hypothetical protein